jgi:predicted RNA-binding Zn-ribbon protein involved in translation (DUF1610 family)
MISAVTLLVGILFYWLLGFIVGDIGSIAGPSWQTVEADRVDSRLLTREQELKREISDTQRTIEDETKLQVVLRDRADNAETTMNRLAELQKLNLQTGVESSDTERQALAESERLFLDTQRRYQEVNERVDGLTGRLRQLESEQRTNSRDLVEARRPARAEYDRLRHRHQLKLGFAKLAVLLPLLAIVVFVTMKHRGRVYMPITYAAGSAIALKVLLVMHDHFPRRYFKYILILAALGAALLALVYLIRMVTYPKRSWLLKQYREAYERFLCPICAFPIRRGPLRFSFWNRRTAKKLTSAPSIPGEQETPYVCPVCGTRLYDECSHCHKVRAALLPACSACGTATEVPTSSPANSS